MKKSKLLSVVCVTVAAVMTVSMLAGCSPETSSGGDDENRVLTGISVESEPNKTVYTEGEYFSAAGMRIQAEYDNDTMAFVTAYTWTPYEALTMDDTEITITYTEGDVTATCTQPITVTAPPAGIVGIQVEIPPTKLEYNAGETFDKSGMLVRTLYDDGTLGADVTNDVSYSPYAPLTVNDTVVTLTYNYRGTTYTTSVDIIVNGSGEGDVEIAFGGGVYRGMHSVILGETTDSYELSGISLADWTYNGTYVENPFKRAQSHGLDQYLLVTMDYSKLADKSEIGFSASMIRTRGRTVVQVSTDLENWTDVGYAQGGAGVADQFNSAYNEKVTALRGRVVADNNLYEFYWSLSDFADDIGPDGLIYVKFGYSDDYTNTLESGSQVVGADVIDHVSYYDSLRIGATLDPDDGEDGPKNSYTLTIADGYHASFAGGAKTAEVQEGAAFPEVTFEEGYADLIYGWATENATEWWKASEFKMPSRALTVYPVYDYDDYIDKTSWAGDGRLYYGEPKSGYNLSQMSGVSLSLGTNQSEMEKYVLDDYTLASYIGINSATAGGAFRLHTGYTVEANVQYTITYELYNVGEADMSFKLYQINSGVTLTEFYESVELKAGEHKTVTLTFQFGSSNGNLLSYFVFNEACTNAKLAINASIKNN